jgi:hypothetical protein
MEDRLTRVELKIDRLSETMVSLARAEEQISTVFKRQSAIDDKITAIESKIDAMALNAVSGRFAERLFWVVVVAGSRPGLTQWGNHEISTACTCSIPS